MVRRFPLAAALLLAPAAAFAQNATTAGEARAPYPTLENLSLEWLVSGDANANGAVSVRYRKSGAAAWLDALPLRRIPAGSAEGFSWANRHAGSIFGLSPATRYEVELTLSDPDGGNATRSLEVTTRAVPGPASGAAVKTVTPASFAAELAAAQAGDLLLLADGAYPGFTFGKDGSEAQPIVIRADNAGGAVFSGDIRLDGRKYVQLEGLTVNGKIKFNDAVGIAITRCIVNTVDDGIISYGPGSTNGVFCDNVVRGPTTWADPNVGASGNNLGEGIAMTGPGNVICHNRVVGFRDCVSTLEDASAINQVSIDIYGNDLDVCADDAIEADFTMGNSRVYANRITNSFVGLSSQPSLGGPAYFIRNVMFNVIYTPFKLHRGSVGDVAFHNTVVKCGDAFAVYASVAWSRAYFRNNLLIGGIGGGSYGGYSNGDGRVLALGAADASCSFDYDGLGSIGTNSFRGNIGGVAFSSLAELRSRTSEKNAVQVDLGVFASAPAFPSSPFPAAAMPDLSLGPGSAAVDKGERLANINDGFTGSAPDLGAYELGRAVPEYGPRSGSGGSTGAAGGAGTSGVAGAAGSGAVSAGGSSGSGAGGASGAVALGGSAGAGGASGSNPSADAGDADGGCGCRAAGSKASGGWLAALGLLLLARARRSTSASARRNAPARSARLPRGRSR
jgi:MYXO-CTERM domain-containing protein